MKHLGSFLALLLLVFAQPVVSSGQIEPTANSIGIYFDTSGNTNEYFSNPPELVSAYLVATRMTLGDGVVRWRGAVECSEMVSAVLPSGGVNQYFNGPEFLVFFDVTNPSPLPVSSAVVLAELQVQVSSSASIDLSVLPLPEVFGDGYHVEGTSGSVVLFPPVHCDMPPCYPAVVARINGPGPVSAETSDWGTVKAMYR